MACTITALAFTARQGWLSDEWRDRVQWLLTEAQSYLPSEEWLRYLAWLAGIAVSAVGAAVTLLASWHFAEINLPRRLKELKDSHMREHLTEQPGLLVLARRGLGPVVADIETSRMTLLRKWLSSWNRKEGARILAASANRLKEETSALSAAVEASQHRQITAHLIRGYQHASQGDDDKAFEEFEDAARVRADDIVSRDIAAGWARRMGKLVRELEFLEALQQAAHSRNDDLNFAMALRREAEVLAKGIAETDWSQARQRLENARGLLLPLVSEGNAKIELGRVLTLFCEVQCRRGKTGRLEGPNRPLTVMKSCLGGVAMHRRVEEPAGEAYGYERALQVEQRVVELRGSGDDQDDDT
jgi:hypothetical protein